MSKRVADKQLTDQNWQEEEAEEEVGEFRKASDDVLKTRVIRTAKRRAPAAADSAPSAFAGFAGFGATNGTNGAAKPSFSFGVKAAEAPKPSFSFSAKPVEAAPVTSSTDLPNKNELKDEVFLKKLKKLNESVLKFAQEHVSKNPLVILTSVFDDYTRHLTRIQGEKVLTVETSSTKDETPEKPTSTEETKEETKEATTEETKEATPEPKAASPGFKFETKEAAKEAPVFGGFGSSTSSEKPSFSFGTAAAKPAFSFAPADSSTKPSFSFKPAENTTDAKPVFSFKPAAEASSTMPAFFAAKPFTGFGTLGGAPSVPAPAAVVEEEEAAPVVEKTEHIEKDGLYHVKCKLFLKSGDGWNEKGVGIANLKECGDKVQLLIRNDTTMGTVVLNTLLHDKVPITHMGKNSLMIVVASAGEGDKTSTDTYLIRVKNKDVADTLYAELEKYKSGIPSAE